ncbi:hypothetical protein HMPREF0262_03170 [Clostridium sp. ATCC 29733]|nr:hypothetical protein HMPREF0262_03170 [Clostridium sp. ATCC 29733]
MNNPHPTPQRARRKVCAGLFPFARPGKRHRKSRRSGGISPVLAGAVAFPHPGFYNEFCIDILKRGVPRC